MYSFGPLPKVGKSGRVIGAHQKIDRVARRHLDTLLETGLSFPDIATILRFEGINGPDGIKLKSPGVDEPWHFVDPTNPDDTMLYDDVRYHRINLTTALEKNDETRAAFESAWLAHAVTDGLTPAHHEPGEDTVVSLREQTNEKRTVRSRVIVPGSGSARQFVKNNWDHWGAGGVMTTHTMFEAGVAMTIQGLRFDAAMPSSHMIVRLKSEGFDTLFHEAVQSVAALGLYDQYKKRGWTRRIAGEVRRELVPRIIETVVLSWYAAYADALRRRARRKT